MHDSSCRFPTTQSARAPAWSHRTAGAPRSTNVARAAVYLSITAIVLLSQGCASTEKVDVAIKPTTPLIRHDLLRLTRREYQDCITAFYQDDWDRLKLHGQQLAGLSERWKDQRAKADEEAVLREQSRLLGIATTEVNGAAEKKDVMGVTVGLRKVAAAIAVLDKLPAPPGESNTLPDAKPSEPAAKKASP